MHQYGAESRVSRDVWLQSEGEECEKTTPHENENELRSHL